MNEYFQNYKTIDQFSFRLSKKLLFQKLRISNSTECEQTVRELQYPDLDSLTKATLLQIQPVMLGLTNGSLFAKFGQFAPLLSGKHQGCIDKFVILNEFDMSKKI